MMDLVVLSATLLLSAALIFLAQKWRRRKRRAALQVRTPKPKSYAAVGIRTHVSACAAVQEFYGKRFLGSDAPAVPVVGCTVRQCPCRYMHFADRRAEDRRAQFGIHETLRKVAGVEQRRGERRFSPAWA